MARTGLKLDGILQAAEELANERGMVEVTLTTLAQQLQIKPPSLYNHVNGLNGLRKVMALHSMKELGTVLTRAAVGRSGDAAVRAMAQAYIDFARRRPGLYEAMLYVPDWSDDEVRNVGDAVADLVIRVLSEGYGLENEAAIHAARGLRSILHGFASLEQKGGFGLPIDVDQSIKVIIDTLIAGLLARSI